MQESEYIQLQKQQKIYIPVMKATLHISMSKIEHMEPFTELVIRGIGQGKTLDDLIDITSLSRYLVEDEIFRLQGWGFIALENEHYRLTEIGERYLFLLTFVERANEETRNVLVNGFNGRIIPFKEELFTRDEIPSDGIKLKKKVVKELFQNRNYSNSKEFYIYHHLFQLTKSDELLVDDIDAIEVTVQCQPQLYYIAHSFNQIPVVPTPEADVVVERPFMQIKAQFTTEELETYQNIIQTLKLLDKFDDELLSTKALTILEQTSMIEELTRPYADYVVDLVSGNLVEEVESKKEITRHFKIHLSYDPCQKEDVINQLQELIAIPRLKINLEFISIEQKGVIYTNLEKLMEGSTY